MANPQIGILLPPQLAAGYCYPSDPQVLANDFFSLAQVVSSTTTTIGMFYNFGHTIPLPEFNPYPWLKRDGMDGPPVRWFIFFNGQWVWPHEVAAEDQERRFWVGTEAELILKDRPGESALDPITDTTGAFWEVDHDFDGRFPIGPGTIPTSSPAAVVAVGGTSDDQGNSGEYEHTLTIPEMPAHSHLPPEDQPATDIDRDAGNLGIGLDSANTFPNADTTWTRETGGDEPHNNMPPYRGAFMIKRTARVYYVGA